MINLNRYSNSLWSYSLSLQDPKKSPVWEITGNEFTKSDIHTAADISVRFPRITRMRDDKTWQTATSMKELQVN